LWEEVFSDEGLDIDFFITRVRRTAEPLPWDHIDTMVSKDFLINEWDNATKGEHTADCRNGDCNHCGVCDFEVIEPKVFTDHKDKVPKNIPAARNKDTFYKKFKVSFSKLDQAKYFGHLELVKIIIRAFRRARIPVKFSEGFHPKPVISFEDPLPIGLESLDEKFYVFVNGNIQSQTIIEGLNQHFPEGLRIIDCQLAPRKALRNTFSPPTYLVTKKNGSFNKEDLASFVKKSEFIVTRTHRKGKIRQFDLKEMVIKITMLSPNRLKMTLRSEPGKTVRPFEVLEHIFELSKEEIKQAAIVKI
jgi:radical SAM-linked protein